MGEYGERSVEKILTLTGTIVKLVCEFHSSQAFLRQRTQITRAKMKRRQSRCRDIRFQRWALFSA